MVRVADYIVDFLADKGIGQVYTITGWGTLYLTDALAKTDRIRTVSMHNEQAVAYATYGYSRGSDNIGACVLSAGCAGTNAITGVLCAWQDAVPAIFISGQNLHTQTSYYTGKKVRTYGSQENNIVSIVEPITKYAVMLTSGDDVAYELEKAYHMALEGRRGPVWIDVPIDIQNARVDENLLRHYVPDNDSTDSGLKNLELIKKSADMLLKSSRPVILIGNGVRASGCADLVESIAEKMLIPVVYSPSAVDVMDNTRDFAIGAIGSHGGCRVANFTIQNADYLLAIGSRLSAELIGEPFDKFAREAKKVVVDIDAEEHSKGIIDYDLFVCADASDYLSKLLQMLDEKIFSEWMAKVIHWKEIFPKCADKYMQSELVDLHYLGKVISDKLPENGSVTCDAGFEELIIPPMLTLDRTKSCVHPYSQGAMGVALPAAIGVYGATECCVVSVNGDGSFMMNMQELQTIRYNDLPIKIIITNNDFYAVIRKRQKDLFRTRTIGTDNTNGVAAPDYRKVAEAFDIPYMRIEGTTELHDGIDKLLSINGPVICEVMCVTEQEYLHNSFVIGKGRKVERRSLEDQSPFMDRDLFVSEMIIEPVDYEN